ncbi:MAG: hypothetical protein QNJ98_08050 [Planctomycetota bacterium]|nr:hypothetical protein [Planctomycetota bacterium]
MPRSASRLGLLMPLVGVLVAATVGLAGWQLFAGDRLASAGQWIGDTQDWQLQLVAVSEAIEAGETLDPFPIRPDEVGQRLYDMTVSFPLVITDHEDAAQRANESHELLQQRLEDAEKLGPLASFAGLPPLLRTAAIDAEGLIRPVRRMMGREAEEAGRAGLLLGLAAAACAALLIVFLVQVVRLGRAHDRLARHLAALEAQRSASTDRGDP